MPDGIETFRTLTVQVLADDEVRLWFANLLMQEPSPMAIAPAAAAATLRILAERLDDLAKANAIGLSPELALQFAGLKRPSPGGVA